MALKDLIPRPLPSLCWLLADGLSHFSLSSSLSKRPMIVLRTWQLAFLGVSYQREQGKRYRDFYDLPFYVAQSHFIKIVLIIQGHEIKRKQ
jgi:hypothetical protein